MNPTNRPNVARARNRDWAILATDHPGKVWEMEIPLDRPEAEPDPRVFLDFADPRVGRVARWVSGHSAVVHAVIHIDGIPAKLLLQDNIGYPWVRVSLDAQLKPVKETESSV